MLKLVLLSLPSLISAGGEAFTMREIRSTVMQYSAEISSTVMQHSASVKSYIESFFDADVGASKHLTSLNFEEETNGKLAFVKFYAPWCGHCKRLQPAWSRLTEDFADNETIIVAEVDCTSEEGKAICQEQGIEGFPTIKFGSPNNLEDYSGSRDYAALKTFADEMKPKCGLDFLDLCDEEERAKYDALLLISQEELEANISEREEVIKSAETLFQEEVQKLQTKFEELKSEMEEKTTEAKSGDYKNWKAALAMKQREENQAESETKVETEEKEEI
jgi:protein disulfide-isomerase A6